MAQYSANTFKFFCICQDLSIKEIDTKEIIKTYYGDTRKKEDSIKLSDILKYIIPREDGKIENYPYSIRYFYQFFPSESVLVDEITSYLDDKHNKEKINEIINEIKEKINGYYQSDGNEYNWNNSKIKISVQIDAKRGSISYDELEDIWKKDEITFLSEIQKKYELKSEYGFICPTILLDEKLKVIGNMVPRKLPLSLDLESMVGKTTINGITLDFEDSPLGLDNIEFDKNPDGMDFSLKSLFNIEVFKDTPKIVVDYVNNILDFFTEEISK